MNDSKKHPVSGRRQSVPVPFKNILPVTLIFLLGSGISIGTFLFLSAQENNQIRAQFIIDAKDRYNAIKTETRQNRNILQSLAAFFYSSAYVDRSEFENFSSRILKEQPNIQALEWVRAVPDQDRDAYERRMKEEVSPDFEIKEIAPGGGLIRAARRTEYYPIEYIEPIAPYNTFLGLDIGTIPVKAQAMQTAREQNKSVSTPRLLVQNDRTDGLPFSEDRAVRSGQYGFMLFQPIFKLTEGKSPEKLLGFVAAVLSSKQTVTKAMKNIAPVGIDIYYYDSAPQDKYPMLYYWPSVARKKNDIKKLIQYEEIEQLGGLYWINKIEVIGRMRYLLFVPTSVYFEGKRTIFPGLLAAALWIITGMLSYYFYTHIRRTALIEKLVEQRTEDLKQANENLIFEVAERKKAEKAAQEVAHLKSEFASTVSHELRTPLTVIKGGIDVLNDEVLGEVNADQKDMLGSVKNNVDRLSRLINDVLDYQKLESGKTRFAMKDQILNTIVHGLVQDIAPTASKKGLKLIREIPADPVIVSCDKDKIIQVLFNLLTNALKFTDQGSITVRLERTEQGSAKVSIKDEGPGIKEEDKTKLFRTFSQLESVGTRTTGGTGLGLSICKRIIEGHGGTIGVDSVFGKGSAFYFTLKLKGSSA